VQVHLDCHILFKGCAHVLPRSDVVLEASLQKFVWRSEWCSLCQSWSHGHL